MMRILVADPDDDTRFILTEALRHICVEVVQASAAETAHDLATRGFVDAVILNYPMRMRAGMSLTRAIRNDPRIGRMPIVNVTSHVTEKLLADAAADGVDRTIPKPADVVTVIEAIESLLVARGARLRGDEARRRRVFRLGDRRDTD
jgi:CheY-like chemotaxis protein